LTDQSEDGSAARFRHSKFRDYLVVYNTCQATARTLSKEPLSELINEVTSARLPLSAVQIRNVALGISKRYFPSVYAICQAAFSHSSQYISDSILGLRLAVSAGDASDKKDIEALLLALADSGAEICWEGFFVLAAKRNATPTAQMMDAFKRAWDTNPGRTDRWKLTKKIAERGLLFEEEALGRIVRTGSPDDWYELIDRAIEAREQDVLKDASAHYEFESVLKLKSTARDMLCNEWKRVLEVLSFTINGRDYRMEHLECDNQI
jgi:hypothetical protein